VQDRENILFRHLPALSCELQIICLLAENAAEKITFQQHQQSASEMTQNGAGKPLWLDKAASAFGQSALIMDNLVNMSSRAAYVCNQSPSGVNGNSGHSSAAKQSA
jgi:hypothetical protein